MPRSLIALGSNLGDRALVLRQAVERLETHPQVRLLACSRWHETGPIGGPAGQGAFLNGVLSLETELSAVELLALLQQIETDLGRTRGEHWAARTLDLDLLLHGDETIETPALTVPHPRMAFRRFVLEPATEVAAEMLHPSIGWSIRALKDHLDTAANYVALLGMPGSGKTHLAESLASAFGGRLLADPARQTPQQGPGDPPSHDCQRQIQFLDRRRSVLERRSWSSSRRLTVSDFYFDQSLAYARVALNDNDYETFHLSWSAARKEVIAPKLLVVLDLSQGAGRQSEPETQLEGERPEVDRLREELSRLAGRGGLGPVLRASSAGSQPPLAEISAAIAAMQSSRVP